VHPLRLTVGRRSLESGAAEVQVRRGLQDVEGIPLDAEPEALQRLMDELWRSVP